MAAAARASGQRRAGGAVASSCTGRYPRVEYAFAIERAPARDGREPASPAASSVARPIGAIGTIRREAGSRGPLREPVLAQFGPHLHRVESHGQQSDRFDVERRMSAPPRRGRTGAATPTRWRSPEPQDAVDGLLVRGFRGIRPLVAHKSSRISWRKALRNLRIASSSSASSPYPEESRFWPRFRSATIPRRKPTAGPLSVRPAAAPIHAAPAGGVLHSIRRPAPREIHRDAGLEFQAIHRPVASITAPQAVDAAAAVEQDQPGRDRRARGS